MLISKKSEDKTKNQLIAFSFGTIKLGERLKKPHIYAEQLLKEIPAIKECYILTGDWDILIKFHPKDMDEYYDTTWTYGKYLTKGWGTIVSKEFLRKSKIDKKMTIFTLCQLALGKDSLLPEEYAREWLEEFPNIEEIYVIVGTWDILVKYKVDTMEEYYQTTWSLGKYLTRGSGYIVSKTIKT